MQVRQHITDVDREIKKNKCEMQEELGVLTVELMEMKHGDFIEIQDLQEDKFKQGDERNKVEVDRSGRNKTGENQSKDQKKEQT